ncbi:hypothetical protein Y032_0334g2823 [Ancylostoma ceylanicum]|uniref:Uncharacterized protein n=1 Tax=Ancylostoma ceylanicum TaxID=53326 RepID=A0A016RYM4_9BILA|nr:hypothetical protein Y032_0334g2823 [Ancylostoma ceylanicum]
MRMLRGAPKKRWTDAVYKDMKEVGVTTDDRQDRALWRSRSRTADLRMRGTNAREKKKKKHVGVGAVAREPLVMNGRSAFVLD